MVIYRFFRKRNLLRVNSKPINTKLFKSIVNSDIKIDEERIEKIRNNLENKYVYNGTQNFMIKSCFYQEVIYCAKAQ